MKQQLYIHCCLWKLRNVININFVSLRSRKKSKAKYFLEVAVDVQRQTKNGAAFSHLSIKANTAQYMHTCTHAHLHEHTSFHGSWTWNGNICGFEPTLYLKWLSLPLHKSTSPCLHTFAQWSTCCHHKGAHHSLINKSDLLFYRVHV